MNKDHPETNKKLPSWYGALTPLGRTGVAVSAVVITALALYAFTLTAVLPTKDRIASISALITAIGSLVALLVAASTAGNRRVDELRKAYAEEKAKMQDAEKLQCTRKFNSNRVKFTVTNYGEKPFSNIRCTLAGKGVMQEGDCGHVPLRDQRPESAFRDWRDAPTGEQDEAAKERTKEMGFETGISVLGGGGQVTISAQLPPELDNATNRAALGVILHFTDIDGNRWERELNLPLREERELDESGKHRWFRRPLIAGVKHFWDGVPEGNPTP